MINDCGVDFVVVHGRTKIDAYKKEKIDYNAIALIKEKIKIPLIANGEIDSYDKAKEVLRITNANGIMIGRFALKEPWIFYQLKHDTKELPKLLKQDIVLEHFDNMIDQYGERGCIMFRKNLHIYAKNHQNAHEFRIKVNSMTESKEMRDSIIAFFNDEFIK
mgnify:FL=1